MYQKQNKKMNILRLYLNDYKQRFYLREIAKLSKLPLKTTQNLLVKLEQEKIMKSSIEGKNKYFYLNLDNIQTKLCLLETEISQTRQFMEKYPFVKSFISQLKNISAPIIVFGSFARLKETKDSDIDLLTISDKKLNFQQHILPYKIHEIKLNKNSFLKAMKKNEAFIEEIKKNHIIINNHSFFINAMWDNHAR